MKVKLETKMGLYAATILFGVMLGLFLFLYNFELYNGAHIYYTIAIKGIGVGLLHLAAEIHSKHFKKR